MNVLTERTSARMTRNLNEILLDPDRRPAVVADLEELVDLQVSDSSGVAGAVVKTGYATVKKLKPGIVGSAVDRMLGEFSTALAPYYADYRAGANGTAANGTAANGTAANGTAANGDFGAYLSDRPDAADALLGVADARAERTSSEGVKKVYAKLRPTGQRNVAEALPRLGRLIDKHATP